MMITIISFLIKWSGHFCTPFTLFLPRLSEGDGKHCTRKGVFGLF
jgi:hypothetical protein